MGEGIPALAGEIIHVLMDEMISVMVWVTTHVIEEVLLL